MVLTNIIVTLILTFTILILAFFMGYALITEDSRPISQKVLWAIVTCCAAGLVLSVFALLVICAIRLISMIFGA